MKKGTWYHLFLLAAFLAVWAWAAIEPVYPDDWLLENYLVFIFVPLILLLGFYFRLSNLSYTLITVFMILHVIGAHYTYSEVPFGYTLQSWFDSQRNMYDRLVHFSFGLLLAYPIREVFIRITRVKGFWGYYLPLDVTLAFSAVYELIEWGAAVVVNPEAGLAFLGTQGDVWDSQKDILIASIGATIAMLITFIVNLLFNKNCMKEIKDSFKIPKGDAPLGEVKLGKMLSERNAESRKL